MNCQFLHVAQFVVLCWTAGSIRSQQISTESDQQTLNSKNGNLESSYFFYQRPEYPRDCDEIQDQCSSDISSGVYLIKPDGYPEPFEVYCDNVGFKVWTVIYRRTDGYVDFNRKWIDYKTGFGFLSHEVWIGNEKLSSLTNQKKYELLINFTNSDGASCSVTYDVFRISDEFGDYTLTSLGEYSGNASECLTLPAADCQEIYDSGNESSGIYTINPSSWPGSPFEVYCNMTDGGGWTTFQRRTDGTVDFYRDWNSYKVGFGRVDHEFWLGNDKLYYLTNQKRYTIRIDLVDQYGLPFYAKYDFYRINNEDDLYRLSEVGAYTGDADDGGHGSNGLGYSLSYHRTYPFSTYDRDNDAIRGRCALNRHGAWWYRTCFGCNLNGDYNATSATQSIYWFGLPGGNNNDRLIKFTEMKVRPFTT